MHTDLHKPVQRSSCSKCGDCLFILCLIGVGILLQFFQPYQQYIPEYDDNDSQVNFNFAYPNVEPETVPGKSLAMILFFPWLGLLVFDIILLKFIVKQFCWIEFRKQLFLMIRMHYFCLCVCYLSTDTIKLMAGSPRPDFLVTQLEHNENDWEIKNSRSTFISGHASLSMSLLGLLSIMFYHSWKYSQSQHFLTVHNEISKSSNPHSYYLCDFWYLFREIPLIASLFISSPIMLAIYVSCSRIIDFEHFEIDVVAGMLVGFSSSYVSYLVFYNETFLLFHWNIQTVLHKKNDKTLVTTWKHSIQ